MALALILVSSACAVLLGLLLFGPNRAPSTGSTSSGPEPDRIRALEADLERRRHEVEEAKVGLNELRAELKQTKRKLHDQRESEKGGQELMRARTDVERAASQQLEVVRGELAHALAELTKLRADAESSKARRPPPVAAPAAPAPAPTPAPQPVAAATEAERGLRRFRELSDADREKMGSLEHQANRERTRAQELQVEVRRLKGRSETQHRVWVVTKGELDLLKDKFKALEKRLNRTLLERDLLKRAIGDLERRTGLAAGRTELTQEEIARSDRDVEERARVEAERLERRTSATAPAAAAAAPAENPQPEEGLPSDAAPADVEQESTG
jgi:hypothetical protein